MQLNRHRSMSLGYSSNAHLLCESPLMPNQLVSGVRVPKWLLQPLWRKSFVPPEDVSTDRIEAMMVRLLSASEDKQKKAFDSSIQNAIAEHVQPLKDEMKEERNERLHQHTETQTQIAELKSQMEVLQRNGGGNGGGGVFGASRTDEIVIGGFQGKSKAGVIIMCKKLLSSIPGGPTILEDRIGNAPDVVPVKFDTIEAARNFVESQKGVKHFEGLWCNMSQTPEERDNFKKNVQPLFKIKRAILEMTNIEAAKVVVQKSQKKVYVTNGENLQIIAEMVSKHEIIWNSQVSEQVKTRYALLTE